MLYLSRERFSTCYICPEGHSSYSSFQYSDLHSYGLILARLTPRELEVGRVAHSGAASVPEHSSQPTVYLMLRECFFMRHNPLSSVTETLAVEAGIRFSRNYDFSTTVPAGQNARPDPFDVGLSYHSISSTWLHLPRRA